jgi:hypothetical protein
VAKFDVNPSDVWLTKKIKSLKIFPKKFQNIFFKKIARLSAPFAGWTFSKYDLLV